MFSKARTLGFIMLLGGFAAIVCWCASISLFTYTSWMAHTKALPAGDKVDRVVASASLRDVSIETNRQVRFVFWPALVMLCGGVLVGFRRDSLPRRLKEGTRTSDSLKGQKHE